MRVVTQHASTPASWQYLRIYSPCGTCSCILAIQNISATSWPLTFWPWKCGVRVTSDVGYLCANFSLSGPLCSRLRPDVRNRQTSDVRRRHGLMPLPYGSGGIIISSRSRLRPWVLSMSRPLLLCRLYGLGRQISLVSGEDREPQFLFQRISAAIQRFNAVLLHDGFLSSDHPGLVLLQTFIFSNKLYLPRAYTYRGQK